MKNKSNRLGIVLGYRIGMFLGLIALVAGASSAFSQVVWDAEYAGSQLPASPWSSGGGRSLTPDGLTISTGYTEQQKSTVGSLWDPNGGNGTLEVDFRIDVASATPGLFSSVVNYFHSGTTDSWAILIQDNLIQIGSASQVVDLNIGQFYSLRLVKESYGLSAYLDGQSLGSLSSVVGTYYDSNPALDRVALGGNTWTGSVGSDAVVTYSGVRWNNTTAFTPVPEPSVFAYGLLAAGGWMIIRRRRR